MGIDQQLAGDSNQDDLRRLAAAHMWSVLRRRCVPIRLILPGLRTDVPELCSPGDGPTKAASALGVKSAMFGSSANKMVAETSPRPVMPRTRARFLLKSGSAAMRWRTSSITVSIWSSSQLMWAAMERATVGEANPDF